MKKVDGFTLYELVIFLTVLALMGNILFFAYFFASKNFGIAQRQAVLDDVATNCINHYLQLAQTNWHDENLTSGKHTVEPTFCAAPHDQFTIKTKITNEMDQENMINLKNVVVTVTEVNPTATTLLQSQQITTLVADN